MAVTGSRRATGPLDPIPRAPSGLPNHTPETITPALVPVQRNRDRTDLQYTAWDGSPESGVIPERANGTPPLGIPSIRELEHSSADCLGMDLVDWDRLAGWTDVWALAVVFGLASVPWTYAFVAGVGLPLWPAFIASATFFSTEMGVTGLVRGYLSNLSGIVYGAATLWLVDTYFGGGVVALSFVVGAFMLLASLHEAVPPVSFTPGGFFGYATLFSVHAAEHSAFGVGGLPGEFLAAVAAMLIGAVIGYGTDRISAILA